MGADDFLEGPLLVSACLCGEICRYDGGDTAHPLFAALCKRGVAIPVCPEVLGGLSVPRAPCESAGERVMDRDGVDRTAAFREGAARVLAIAREKGIARAVLKEGSPSCGVRCVYDGSFTSKIIPGEGITTVLLRKHGIVVRSEQDF